MMMQLRDFLYLDTARLNSFISQIHGGQVSEITETIRRQGGFSGGIEIRLPTLGGGEIGASKGREDERQLNIQLTDPAYFSALYQYLLSQSDIVNIAADCAKDRPDLAEGQFVEVTGIGEPPVIEYWIYRVRNLVDFLDRNLSLFTQTRDGKGQRRTAQSLSRQQIGMFRRMVDFLADYIQISRKDPGKQFMRVKSECTDYGVWCGLIPDFTILQLEATLPAQVHVVGRVEKVLNEGEIYKIVDFSQFSQSTDMSKLLDALNGFGPLIGQTEISETDLQAQCPDIFVTPIAIFR